MWPQLAIIFIKLRDSLPVSQILRPRYRNEIRHWPAIVDSLELEFYVFSNNTRDIENILVKSYFAVDFVVFYYFRVYNFSEAAVLWTWTESDPSFWGQTTVHVSELVVCHYMERNVAILEIHLRGISETRKNDIFLNFESFENSKSEAIVR